MITLTTFRCRVVEYEDAWRIVTSDSPANAALSAFVAANAESEEALAVAHYRGPSPVVEVTWADANGHDFSRSFRVRIGVEHIFAVSPVSPEAAA